MSDFLKRIREEAVATLDPYERKQLGWLIEQNNRQRGSDRFAATIASQEMESRGVASKPTLAKGTAIRSTELKYLRRQPASSAIASGPEVH